MDFSKREIGVPVRRRLDEERERHSDDAERDEYVVFGWGVAHAKQCEPKYSTPCGR